MSDQQDQAINTLFNALFTPPELFDDEPEATLLINNIGVDIL